MVCPHNGVFTTVLDSDYRNRFNRYFRSSSRKTEDGSFFLYEELLKYLTDFGHSRLLFIKSALL